MDGELAAAGLVEIRAVQKLRVGHDDRQGRFQLVGGIRYELPLLLPGGLHRFYRPPCQQPADEQKGGEAQHPDGGAGLCQIFQSGPLAGHICESDALSTGRDAAAVPQAVFPEDTSRSVGVGGRVRQRFQELLIRQVIVPAAGGGETAVSIQLQNEKGEVDLLRRTAGAIGVKGIRRYALQHGLALRFQALTGQVIHHAENGGEHEGDDEHIDADEFQPQLSDHSATSRW